MKTSLIILYVCSIFLLKAQTPDYNGIWADSSSNSFTNCYAIFSVKNDSVFMTHYLEFNGEPFVEYGIGILKDAKLSYRVCVSKQIKGWTTTKGHHILKLDADGKTLRGSYTDNSGNSGPLVFKKKFL